MKTERRRRRRKNGLIVVALVVTILLQIMVFNAVVLAVSNNITNDHSTSTDDDDDDGVVIAVLEDGRFHLQDVIQNILQKKKEEDWMKQIVTLSVYNGSLESRYYISNDQTTTTENSHNGDVAIETIVKHGDSVVLSPYLNQELKLDEIMLSSLYYVPLHDWNSANGDDDDDEIQLLNVIYREQPKIQSLFLQFSSSSRGYLNRGGHFYKLEMECDSLLYGGGRNVISSPIPYVDDDNDGNLPFLIKEEINKMVAECSSVLNGVSNNKDMVVTTVVDVKVIIDTEFSKHYEILMYSSHIIFPLLKVQISSDGGEDPRIFAQIINDEQNKSSTDSSKSRYEGSIIMGFGGEEIEVPVDCSPEQLEYVLEQLDSIGDVSVSKHQYHVETLYYITFHSTGNPSHIGDIDLLKVGQMNKPDSIMLYISEDRKGVAETDKLRLTLGSFDQEDRIILKEVGIIVIPVNDPPVLEWANSYISIDEDTPLCLEKLKVAIKDVDNNVVSLSIQADFGVFRIKDPPPAGHDKAIVIETSFTSTDTVQGLIEIVNSLIFYPNSHFNGLVEMKFQVSDDNDTTVKVLLLHIKPVNDDPKILTSSTDIVVWSPTEISLPEIMFDDADENAVLELLVTSPVALIDLDDQNFADFKKISDKSIYLRGTGEVLSKTIRDVRLDVFDYSIRAFDVVLELNDEHGVSDEKIVTISIEASDECSSHFDLDIISSPLWVAEDSFLNVGFISLNARFCRGDAIQNYSMFIHTLTGSLKTSNGESLTTDGLKHASLEDVNVFLGSLVYRPAPNFHGLDEIDVLVRARNNGILSMSESIPIYVQPVNDRPVVKILGGTILNVTEGEEMTLPSIQVTDDSDTDLQGTATIEVTFDVTHGLIYFNYEDIAFVHGCQKVKLLTTSVYGPSTSLCVQVPVNTASNILLRPRYIAPQNFWGEDLVVINVHDSDLVVRESILINILEGIPFIQWNIGKFYLSTREDTLLNFSLDMSYSANISNSIIHVTLECSLGGLIQVFDELLYLDVKISFKTNRLDIDGRISEVSDLLSNNHLLYQGPKNFNGIEVIIATFISEATGIIEVTEIHVENEPVDDLPSITSSTSIVGIEDTACLSLNGFEIIDDDEVDFDYASFNVSITVPLGELKVADHSAILIAVKNLSEKRIQLVGSLNSLNEFISTGSLCFTPPYDWHGETFVETSISCPYSLSSICGRFQHDITIESIYDRPTLQFLPDIINVSEDNNFSFGSELMSKVQFYRGDIISENRLLCSIESVHGVVNPLEQTHYCKAINASHLGSWLCSVDTINEWWKSLVYTPPSNFHGVDELHFMCDNEELGSLSIYVHPVNDPPVILVGSESFRVSEKGVYLCNALTYIYFQDIDEQYEYDIYSLELKISGDAYFQWDLALLGGLAVQSSDDKRYLQLKGSLTLLNDASRIILVHPSSDFAIEGKLEIVLSDLTSHASILIDEVFIDFFTDETNGVASVNLRDNKLGGIFLDEDASVCLGDTLTVFYEESTPWTLELQLNAPGHIEEISKEGIFISEKIKLNGVVQDIEKKLNQLFFVPEPNWNGFSKSGIVLSITDGRNSSSTVVPLFIDPIDDPPAFLYSDSQALSVFEGEEIILGGKLDLKIVDQDENDILNDVPNCYDLEITTLIGHVRINDDFVAGDISSIEDIRKPSNRISLRGDLVALNSALEKVSYQANESIYHNDTIKYQVIEFISHGNHQMLSDEFTQSILILEAENSNPMILQPSINCLQPSNTVECWVKGLRVLNEDKFLDVSIDILPTGGNITILNSQVHKPSPLWLNSTIEHINFAFETIIVALNYDVDDPVLVVNVTDSKGGNSVIYTSFDYQVSKFVSLVVANTNMTVQQDSCAFELDIELDSLNPNVILELTSELVMPRSSWLLEIDQSIDLELDNIFRLGWNEKLTDPISIHPTAHSIESALSGAVSSGNGTQNEFIKVRDYGDGLWKIETYDPPKRLHRDNSILELNDLMVFPNSSESRVNLIHQAPPLSTTSPELEVDFIQTVLPGIHRKCVDMDTCGLIIKGGITSMRYAIENLRFKLPSTYSGTFHILLSLSVHSNFESEAAVVDTRSQKIVTVNVEPQTLPVVNFFWEDNEKPLFTINEDTAFTFNDKVRLNSTPERGVDVNYILSIEPENGYIGEISGKSVQNLLELEGSISFINDQLEKVFYKPLQNWFGLEFVSLTLSSVDSSLSLKKEFLINVQSENDNPMILINGTRSNDTSSPAFIVFEDVESPLLGIKVDDEDHYHSIESFVDFVELTLIVSSGILRFEQSSDDVFSEIEFDNVSDKFSLSLKGSLQGINIVLDSLKYISKKDFHGTDLLELILKDFPIEKEQNSLMDYLNCTIYVNSVDDLPVINLPFEDHFIAVEDAVQPIMLYTDDMKSFITVYDVDNEEHDYELKMECLHGRLSILDSFDESTKVIESNVSEFNSIVEFSGKLSLINDILEKVHYLSDINFDSNLLGLDKILISVMDSQGDSMAEIAVYVKGVNDPPIISSDLDIYDLDSFTANQLSNRRVGSKVLFVSAHDKEIHLGLHVIDVENAILYFRIKCKQGYFNSASLEGVQRWISGELGATHQIEFQSTQSMGNNFFESLSYVPASGSFGSDLIEIYVEEAASSTSEMLNSHLSIPVKIEKRRTITPVLQASIYTVSREDTPFQMFSSEVVFHPHQDEIFYISVDVDKGGLVSPIHEGVALNYVPDNKPQNFISGYGSCSSLNRLLMNLLYIPERNWNSHGGSFVNMNIRVHLSNTTEASAKMYIDVLAVNDEPYFEVTGHQLFSSGVNKYDMKLDESLFVDEDQSLIMDFIELIDVDLSSGAALYGEPSPFMVSLNVSNGRVKLSSTLGLHFIAGSDDSSNMKWLSSYQHAKDALRSFKYTGNANYFGKDSLTVFVSDEGSIGEGGRLNSTLSVPIYVDPKNDRPTWNLTASRTLCQFRTYCQVPKFYLLDPDNNSDKRYQVDISAVFGSLIMTKNEDITLVDVVVSEKSTFRVVGSLQDLNDFFGGVVYLAEETFPDYDDSLRLYVRESTECMECTDFVSSETSMVIVVEDDSFPQPIVSYEKSADRIQCFQGRACLLNGFKLTGVDTTEVTLLVQVARGGLTSFLGRHERDFLEYTGSADAANIFLSSLSYFPHSYYLGSDFLDVSVITYDGRRVSFSYDVDILLLPKSPSMSIPSSSYHMKEDDFLTIEGTKVDGEYNLNMEYRLQISTSNGSFRLARCYSEIDSNISMLNHQIFNVSESLEELPFASSYLEQDATLFTSPISPMMMDQWYKNISFDSDLFNIDNCLNQIIYKPSQNFNSEEHDNGYGTHLRMILQSMTNGAIVSDEYVSIHVAAVNDAPKIHLPFCTEGMTLFEDEYMDISFSIQDVDDHILSVAVRADNGTLLVQHEELSLYINGNRSDQVDMYGWTEDIDYVLKNISFKALEHYSGSAGIVIEASDESLTTKSSCNFTVLPVVDGVQIWFPMNENDENEVIYIDEGSMELLNDFWRPPAFYSSVVEDEYADKLGLSEFDFGKGYGFYRPFALWNWDDFHGAINTYVTKLHVSTGKLFISSINQLKNWELLIDGLSIHGNNTNSLELIGSIKIINELASNIAYIASDKSFNGWANFSVTVSHILSDRQIEVKGNRPIFVKPVNSPPIIQWYSHSNTHTSYHSMSVENNKNYQLVGSFSVSDIDIGNRENELFTCSVNIRPCGRLRLSPSTDLSFIGGSPLGGIDATSSELTFHGQVKNINTALSRIEYSPLNCKEMPQIISLKLKVSDNGYSGEGLPKESEMVIELVTHDFINSYDEDT